MRWIAAYCLLALPALVAPRPVPCEVQANIRQVTDSIVTGPVDQSTAARNRVTVESYTGVKQLPTGTIIFDRLPKPQSGVTLLGPATFKQSYEFGNFPYNCTLGAPNSSIGHVDVFTRTASNRITTAAADKCPPGTLVYLWQNTVTGANPSPVRQRLTVTARSGQTLVLDGPVDLRCNVLKWFADAAPIADVQEGSAAVVTSRGQWQAGQWVLVTDGPRIANEANGELRRVAGVNGLVVTLDRPLRRPYSLAALVKIQPVENVTLRDLTIELPVNAASESLYASFAVNWRIDRCTIRKTALGNCAGLRFTDCDLGGIQFAASSHDCLILNSRIGSVNYEEGTHDCLIDGCTLGPVGPNMNCVTVNAQAERLMVRNSVLLGGSSPSSQILMFGPGRECVFDGLRLSGGTPCWLKGNWLRLTGVWSDGVIGLDGSDASYSQVKFSNWSRW